MFSNSHVTNKVDWFGFSFQFGIHYNRNLKRTDLYSITSTNSIQDQLIIILFDTSKLFLFFSHNQIFSWFLDCIVVCLCLHCIRKHDSAANSWISISAAGRFNHPGSKIQFLNEIFISTLLDLRSFIFHLFLHVCCYSSYVVFDFWFFLANN